jgi:hypothetical protein
MHMQEIVLGSWTASTPDLQSVLECMDVQKSSNIDRLRHFAGC